MFLHGKGGVKDIGQAINYQSAAELGWISKGNLSKLRKVAKVKHENCMFLFICFFLYNLSIF